MEKQRNDFNVFAEEFGKKYRNTPYNPSGQKIEDLKKIRDEVCVNLSKFTEFYFQFDREAIKQNSQTFANLSNRALAHMMVCQNQFIIPINHEISKRENDEIQKSARKNSRFAFWTFIVSLVLSLSSLALTWWGNYNSGKILDENTNVIHHIDNQVNFILQQDSIILNKIDSLSDHMSMENESVLRKDEK